MGTLVLREATLARDHCSRQVVNQVQDHRCRGQCQPNHTEYRFHRLHCYWYQEWLVGNPRDRIALLRIRGVHSHSLVWLMENLRILMVLKSKESRYPWTMQLKRVWVCWWIVSGGGRTISVICWKGSTWPGWPLSQQIFQKGIAE